VVVNIDSIRSSQERPEGSARSFRRATPMPRSGRTSECVTIGLLNNMAGAAFKATERQFVSLLDSASEGIPIHVSFYTLPGMSRAESGGHHFARHYQGAEALFDTHLDGLIVTGREPKMPSLRDEPYWKDFTEVLEWAKNNTHSAVWSCLAAHAAILHMDGIDRRKSEEKNFGIFECEKVSEHPLTKGLSQRLHVPHSRWNGVAQKDLIDCGYSVLTRTADGGVDAFLKQEQSLFVFFQGHLEYESDTLMREYRRDVGRFVTGETHNHPLLPRSYFDPSTEKALTILRDKAIACRSSSLLTSVAAAMEKTKIQSPWQGSAKRIYRNWLEYICAQKAESQSRHHAGAGLSI
jgi:homoserine O-succinyltransferase/O-acetyltransferase